MNITHFEVVTTAATGAFLGAVGAAGYLVRFMRRNVVAPIKRVERVIQIVEGTPAELVNGYELQPRIPGVMERLSSQDSRIAAVDRGVAGLYPRITTLETQLNPNSGSTVRDAIDRIEQAVTANGQQ